MGYVNDTAMAQFISPFSFGFSAGTWTPTIASNLPCNVRTATAAAFTALIPIPVPSNSVGLKGARLKSIDVFYKILTVATTDFATVELEKVALPVPAAAPGTAFTGTAPAVTCDALHNTAALRKAVGDHTMTVTLTTPVWIDDNDAYVLELIVDCAATAVVTFYGARANFDERL